MAPVQIQPSTPGSSVQQFANPVVSGHLLVCEFREGAVGSTMSVSDDVNGAWTQIIKQENTFDGHSLAKFILPNTLVGTPTVTVAGTGGGTMRFIIAEYSLSGLITVVGSNSAQFSGPGGVWSSGTVAILAGDLMIGGSSNDGNITGAWVAGSSGGAWTIEQTWDANGRVMLEDLTPAASGSFASNPDTTAAGFMDGTSLVAAFRVASVVSISNSVSTRVRFF